MVIKIGRNSQGADGDLPIASYTFQTGRKPSIMFWMQGIIAKAHSTAGSWRILPEEVSDWPQMHVAGDISIPSRSHTEFRLGQRSSSPGSPSQSVIYFRKKSKSPGQLQLNLVQERIQTSLKFYQVSNDSHNGL